MSWIIGLIIGLSVGVTFYHRYKSREKNNLCIHCGAPCDENSDYCPGCGTNLARERARYKPISKSSNIQSETKFCSNCGNPKEKNDSFCSRCGNKL